jgi:ubiquinone/menaquinone biosynthesis C-methylase UbiE
MTTRVNVEIQPDSKEFAAFTRERVVEGGTPERIWQDHRARYSFSIPFVVGRRVLDAACGTGYGAFELASHGASRVDGVDISQDAISFAGERYRHPALHFALGDVTKLACADGSIDVVTSFETIEHITGAAAALSEFARVLVPSGILIVSTPNRIVTSPGKSQAEPPDNKFHLVEYTTGEFDALLAPNYRVIARYGQRMVPGLLYHPMLLGVGRRVVPYGYAPKHGSPELAPLRAGWQSRYLVYVCQKQ